MGEQTSQALEEGDEIKPLLEWLISSLALRGEEYPLARGPEGQETIPSGAKEEPESGSPRDVNDC